MIPTAFIDCAVWASLDNHRSIELILLKGHLVLEVMMAEALHTRLSLSESKIKNLTFSRKVKALTTAARTDKSLMLTLDYLEQLNRIRNKLAHEPFPQNLESSLTAWSEEVLKNFSKHKHQRYTTRTRITQAMSALARCIYEAAHSKTPPTESE